MSLRSLGKVAGLLAVTFALMVAAAAPAMAADDGASKAVLRIGWAQDPQTLNPFVGLDEEDYTVWAINWDLLVNFSPKDLSPSPGIAESWEVSDDKKTVTFKLDPDRKWSDGVPITSADVKYSLEELGGNGALFTSYTDNVKSITTPDKYTVVIKTTRPDARIVGGLLIYIIPKHIWGKVPIKELTSTYQAQIPLVGSGPFVVTKFDRDHIIEMDPNPNFTGPKPKYDQIQFIKYGTQDAVETALKLGEIDMVTEVQASTFNNIASDTVTTVKSASPSFTQLAFNLCPKSICPDANFNPAIQDKQVRQAIAYSIDRNRINQIAGHDTGFVGHGLLSSFYTAFYEEPALDYPFDPEKANQILDDAGYTRDGDGIRSKDGDELSFNLYVRSESPYNIAAAKLVAEMTKEVGIEFKVQVVSVDKLTELTAQKIDGKMAPDFDTFIWGWGGDSYDPSFLLSLMTTDQIGGSSDSFYSNPEYDKLYKEQTGIFDVPKRKEVIKRMTGMLQEDLPYLVLSVDPNLQAYRSDRIDNVKLSCPENETGDIICEQVGYAPLTTIAPSSEASSGGGGGSGAIIAIVAVVILGGVAFIVIRRRRRRDNEPLELEE